MALANVNEAITYLCDRFGRDDAGTRARALGWLQAAETELWSSREWWFRQKATTGATVAGVEGYAVGEVSNTIYQVRVDGGAPLSYVPPTLFAEICSSNPVSDTPRLWTQTPAVNSTGYPEFGLWPRPVANGTWEVVYDLAPKELADLVSSTSQFPASDWMVVVFRALLKGLSHYNLSAEQATAFQEYEQYLGALIEQDNGKGKVKRS